MGKYYTEPLISIPPKPDDENNGVPSDHQVPLSYPRTETSQPRREYKTRKYRPFPYSGLSAFENWITKENWQSLSNQLSPTQCVEHFENIFPPKLESFLPLKEVKYAAADNMLISDQNSKKKTKWQFQNIEKNNWMLLKIKGK